MIVLTKKSYRQEKPIFKNLPVFKSKSESRKCCKKPSQQSSLGSALDPLADKATMFFIYLAFYYTEHIPPWLFWTFIGRDVLLVSHLRFSTFITFLDHRRFIHALSNPGTTKNSRTLFRR